MTANENQWYKGTWEPGSEISPLQTDFATALRIPFLTNPYPNQDYRFGIIVNVSVDINTFWRGEVPTDEEVAVIAGIRNAYVDYMFPTPNNFRAEMEAYAPYDIEDGKPCHYFIKRPNGSWAYRHSQWINTEFVPGLHDTPMTLTEVIGRANLQWGQPVTR